MEPVRHYLDKIGCGWDTEHCSLPFYHNFRLLAPADITDEALTQEVQSLVGQGVALPPQLEDAVGELCVPSFCISGNASDRHLPPTPHLFFVVIADEQNTRPCGGHAERRGVPRWYGRAGGDQDDNAAVCAHRGLLRRRPRGLVDGDRRGVRRQPPPVD